MSGINGFVGRRNFLKLVGIGSAGVAATGLILHEQEVVSQQPSKPQAAPEKKSQPVSPDDALQ